MSITIVPPKPMLTAISDTELETRKKLKIEAIKKSEDAERQTKLLKESEKNEKKRKESKALQKIEDNEFEQLMAEMTPLGFTHSKQVSFYIMKNKLGNKYKNISGIIEMESGGRTWNLKGGFPPKIYAQICSKLGLNNNGSSARVVGFNSFNQLGV